MSEGERHPLRFAVLVVAVAALVRLVPAIVLEQPGHSDIDALIVQGEAIVRGDNIYAHPVLFPYTPYSQYLPGAMELLARATGWRFSLAAKLLPILTDVLTAALLLFLPRVLQTPVEARRRALLWALHPVSILVTAFHGNPMPVVATLILASTLTFDRSGESPARRTILDCSALLLGLAIAIRSFPILFLPVFLLKLRTAGERIRFTVLASLASILSALPFLLFERDSLLREALGYSGFPDFGWAAAVRALTREAQLASVVDYAPTATKVLFLLAWAFWVMLVAASRRQQTMTSAAIVPPLLFYSIYSGVGAQYLVWVLPVALAAARWGPIIAFSIAATTALIPFYAIYHRVVLFGQFEAFIGGGLPIRGVWLLGNILLVATSVVWLWSRYRALVAEASARESTLIPIAIAGSVVVFMVWLGLAGYVAIERIF